MIKRNETLFNINFETESDAELCCKLLNQIDKSYQETIEELDELNDWHKEHYGCTVLEEKLEIGYPRKVEKTLQKYYDYSYNQGQRNLDNVMVYQAYNLLTLVINDIASELGVNIKR